MPTLAFDTATPTAAVALLDGPRVVQRQSLPGRARHGEILLPLVDEVLREHRCGLADLDLVAVGCGPGSFTGLRIGLATAQGLHLARGVRAVGVCSLRALAAPAVAAHGQPVVAVLDAFRGEVYVAVYAPGDGVPEEIVPPFSAAPAEAIARVLGQTQGPVVCVGDGVDKYRDVFDVEAAGRLRPLDGHGVPCPVSLGRHAEHLREHGRLPDVAAPQPIYLRGADAALPRVPLLL